MNIRNAIGGAFALLLAVPAFAGLGEAPTPDATVAAGAGYEIHEIRAESGGVIREYVSPAGIVFGISWNSPLMPNLRAVLGDHFGAFEQAAADSRSSGRRGPISIDRSDLVLQSGGQMRDYRGRAFVPGLLPANVSGEVVQ